MAFIVWAYAVGAMEAISAMLRSDRDILSQHNFLHVSTSDCETYRWDRIQ